MHPCVVVLSPAGDETPWEDINSTLAEARTPWQPASVLREYVSKSIAHWHEWSVRKTRGGKYFAMYRQSFGISFISGSQIRQMGVFIKIHIWYTYLRRADTAGMEGVCTPTEESILFSIL